MNPIHRLPLLLLLFFLPSCDSSPVAGTGGGTAVISYSIPVDSYVKLWIENSYGTEMGTYVDTIQEAGYYSVEIPMSAFPHGIYFSLLRATPVSGGSMYQSERRLLHIRIPQE